MKTLFLNKKKRLKVMTDDRERNFRISDTFRIHTRIGQHFGTLKGLMGQTNIRSRYCVNVFTFITNIDLEKAI